MNREHRETTESIRRNDRPLQPRGDDPNDQITDPDVLRRLRHTENDEAADRLERLAADADLNRRLQLQNYDPDTRDWKKFQSALAEYGYGVFVGWGRSGVLRRMAQQHGRGGVLGYQKIPEGLRLSDDDARELAAELLIVAIDAFRRKTLLHPDPNRRWRPDGGASLRTYFVGRCLMELPDVYQVWGQARRPDLEVSMPAPRHFERSSNPEDVGIAATEVARLRADVEPAVLLMFELQDAGFTYVEIAEQLSDLGMEVTEASVRTRMTRLRARERQRIVQHGETGEHAHH